MKSQTSTAQIEQSPATTHLRGAEAIMKILLTEQVRTIFGYPGGAIMPIYDALYDYMEQMEHVLVRHEQGAIHAAQGYARASGKTGVVFATSGPGATNLVTGLADAMIDSTPLVCLSGQVYAHLLGTDAFQETDVINLTTPVTKWNYQVTEASEIPHALAKAFYIAGSGRPGPVLIDITKNAQLDFFDMPPYEPCTHIRSYKPKPTPRMEYLEEAAALINQAEKPFVIFGQGVILGNAEAEFKAFIEKSGIPAAWTIMGMGALSTNHPLSVGMLGMHGNYAPNVMTNECDVLIAIGMRFDDRVTGRLDKYARQAKIIHLDIDPAEIDKNVMTTVAVWGDCKETLPTLTDLIHEKNHSDWHQRFKDLLEIEQTECIHPQMNPTCDEISMAEVIQVLNDYSQGEAIVVTDVGQHQMVACRYANLKNTRSNITSGGLGTMGFALPAAIGAKYGAPERQVIAIIGDGGVQMTIQELGTVMQADLPVKIIILNNSFLGMVRQWQELFHDRRYSFVNIKSPNYVKVAEGYGIDAALIDSRSDLKAAIAKLYQTDGPYLLEIRVGMEDNVFPMVAQGSSVSEIRLK